MPASAVWHYSRNASSKAKATTEEKVKNPCKKQLKTYQNSKSKAL